MHADQIALVQSTFKLVEPIANTAASLFYDRLFTIDSSLRSMFKGDMEAQGQRLMQAISVVVKGIGRIESILPAVRDLGRRHVRYGVEDAHYDTVGEALLWTLEQGLGDAFTPEVKQAWAEAYGVLASVMKEAAAEEVASA